MVQIKPASGSNNFLLVCIDDMMHPKLMGEGVQFGSPLLIPNITALAEEMLFFDNMQATIPVCKGSRTSMLASASPVKTRVFNNDAEDHILWDFNKTWMALFKLYGETDAIGKVSHDVDCPIPIRNACYTRFHELQKNAVSQIRKISSAVPTPGLPNQVFRDVRLIAQGGSSGKPAWADITLNAAGNDIETVTLVERTRVDSKIQEIQPRYDAAISGEDYVVGDRMRIEGLGYSATTGKFSLPDATCVVEVEKIASYKKFSDEGAYGYGTFTQGATVEKGDTLMVEYFDSIIADLIASSNDRSLHFVTLGMKGPHTPIIPGQAYLDMHPLAGITIPTGYDLPSSYMLRFLSYDKANELYSNGKLAEYARYYLAAVEEQDARLGEVVTSLKANGLWERTNVIFWSDHSFNIGNQNSAALPEGIYKKFKNFGTGTRCFFAMRTPNYPTGRVIREPVSALDIGPTLLEMAGIPVPEYMEGRSLLPALRRPLQWKNDRAAMSFCFGNLSAVKTVPVAGVDKVLRLIRMFNGEELLYDEEADPLNKQNLAGQASYAAALVLMRAALDAERNRLGYSANGTDGDDLMMKATSGGSLAGGLGGDTYIIAATNTVITDTGGNDAVVLQPNSVADTTYTVPSGIETFILEETADPATLTLPDTGTIVIGDVESLTGGAGADALYGSGSGVTVAMGGGSDYVLATNGNDSLAGDAGADTVRALAGSDSVYGGANDDDLNGGNDPDLMYGGTQNDIIYGGGDNDTLNGDDGDDTLWGGDSADILYGGNNADSLSGGAGADSLFGGSGADTLRAGAGAGGDSIDGGSGTNVFQVGVSTGSFTISNWTAGTNNVVQFNLGVGFGPLVGTGAGTQTAAALFTLVMAAAVDSGADTIITVPTTLKTITILGRNKVNFTNVNFTVAQFDENEQDDDAPDSGD